MNHAAAPHRAASEVLWIFLRLGLTSFGGPLAHLGYFREEFVVRRRWLDPDAFADLLALCQFLPGPASSQLGFAIGLTRAGFRGALAAWTAFTLPSAAALVAFALGAHAAQGPAALGLLHGLKLVAVAIVAQAVWGMARSLCPDAARAAIGLAAAATTLALARAQAVYAGQLLVLAGGGLAGLLLCRPAQDTAPAAATAPRPPAVASPLSRRAGLLALGVFSALLVGLPWLGRWPAADLFAAFYRAGALVFGGGHVVLPLLSDAFVATGRLSDSVFLAGYGAAQAVPGPLFTFAAYLGAVLSPAPYRVAGAALALVAIFLPGLLLVSAALPFWHDLRRQSFAQAVMRGINASVVGLLGAALYNPIGTGSLRTLGDAGVALTGFILLTVWRAPPLLIVVGGALSGMALSAA
jgi:chromate transporter